MPYSGWNRVSGGAMTWNGSQYYYDVTLNDVGGTTYRAYSYVYDALGNQGARDENPTEFTITTTYALRSTGPGGGWVFYITDGGAHGLEAATTDQAKVIWAVTAYQSTYVPGGTSTAIGTGSANTDKIIAQNGAGTTYAAGATRAYTGGGKSDWFLPSKDELGLIYTNLYLYSVGGFTNSTNSYWSSSEGVEFTARTLYLGNGGQGSGDKASALYVRAVRAF